VVIISRNFDEKYFSYSCDFNRAILKGKKPFENEFWVRYVRNLKNGGLLLDLGCGKGFFLEAAQKFYSTYGLDISPYAISSARERCRGELKVMDANCIDFGGRQFDIIVCFDVLEHIVDPSVVISQCSRALKKGGLLIVSVPNLESFGRFLKQKDWFGYRDSTHVSLLSKGKWTGLLELAGFTVMDLRYDGLWDSPYFRNLPALPQHFFFKFLSTVLFGMGFSFPEKLGENVFIVSWKS